MDEDTTRRLKAIEKHLELFYSKDDEIRCHGYQYVKVALQEEFQLNEFSSALAYFIEKENPMVLEKLLDLIDVYIETHQHILYKEYLCYPIFKALLLRYDPNIIQSYSLQQRVDETVENIIETFSCDYILKMSLRFLGDQSLTLNVAMTQKCLYILQSVAIVTGNEVPLVSPFTPFEFLRCATARIMNVRLTEASDPVMFQWAGDVLTALYYMNHDEMLTVLRSFDTHFKKSVIHLVMNYGQIEEDDLTEETLSAEEAGDEISDEAIMATKQAKINNEKEENTRNCNIYRCNSFTKTESEPSETFKQLKTPQECMLPIGVPGASSDVSLTVKQGETSEDNRTEDILPAQIYYVSKRDCTPRDAAEELVEESSHEHIPDPDPLKTRDSLEDARKSILKYLRLTARADDDLSHSTPNEERNKQQLLFEIDQDQDEITEQEKYERTSADLLSLISSVGESFEKSEQNEDEFLEYEEDEMNVQSQFYGNEEEQYESQEAFEKTSIDLGSLRSFSESLEAISEKDEEEEVEDVKSPCKPRSPVFYFGSTLNNEEKTQIVDYESQSTTPLKSINEVVTVEVQEEEMSSETSLPDESCKPELSTDTIETAVSLREGDKEEQSVSEPPPVAEGSSEPTLLSRIKSALSIGSKLSCLLRTSRSKSKESLNEQLEKELNSTDNREHEEEIDIDPSTLMKYNKALKMVQREIKRVDKEILYCEEEIRTNENEILSLRTKMRLRERHTRCMCRKLDERFRAIDF